MTLRPLITVIAAFSLGIMLAPAAAAASSPGRLAGTPPGQGRQPGPQQPAAVAAAVPVVTGRSEPGGYRIYLQVGGAGSRPRALVTLASGSRDGERWIGSQCLTGDGRTVVVVIAPWHVSNVPALRNVGASAYAVDVRTSAVRPLLGGVALVYFNPGCGTGSRVALTRFRGVDAAATEVTTLDAGTGRVLGSSTVAGQVTSAVPSSAGVLAAAGSSLVRLDGHTATPVARADGQIFDLTPVRGGVAYLAVHGAGGVSLWQWSAAGASRLASGRLSQVRLFAGTGGRAAVVGVHPRATSVQVLPRVPGLASTLPAPARPTALPAEPGHAAASQTPACAVPRNDVTLQAMQPNAARVDWAIQQAVRGALPGTAESDFPKPAVIVPREVLDGIAAQESNLQQASWHALPGVAGNPLIANYYGTNATATTVDYSKADCGYGLTQVTDYMRKNAPGVTQTEQNRIATDYRENLAAGLTILAQKWTELQQAGITVTNGNPADSTDLENWYLALWDYNSGLHANDGAGNYGLGWSNNPVNPDYPPNRVPFLSQTYADASHPQDWPYQERVFGWMHTPLIMPDGQRGYTGVPAVLPVPPRTLFCDASNSCDPSGSTPTYCTLAGNPNSATYYHCWWHKSAGWQQCSTPCISGTFTVPTSAPEPVNSRPYPPVCTPTGWGMTASSTVIVDNEAADVNLAGCPDPSTGWHNGGTFSTSFSPDSVPAIDWHQLGVGFGGHIWMTHSEPSGDPRLLTGTWTPSASVAGIREIRVFIPDNGATTTDALYTIHTKTPDGDLQRVIDQNFFSNQWVSLGFFKLGAGASVSLSNQAADGNGTADVAFDAVAFLAPPPQSYVALGDSYSAGEGVPDWVAVRDPGTDWNGSSGEPADTCHRSPDAYSRQYAAKTTTYASEPVILGACSGAVIADMSNKNSANPGEQAQLSLIPKDARLVTLTIGGNDAQFAPILTDCVSVYVLIKGDCVGAYSVCPAPPSAPDECENSVIDGLKPRLVSLYKQIRLDAPNAQIWVLTYPDIFPDPHGSNFDATRALMTANDIVWLKGLAARLDGVIKSAAVASGANIKVSDEQTAFAGHEVWTNPASGVWVNEVDVLDPSDTNQFHPTSAGYAKLASDLRGRITIP
jgi:lysophospholipase L1-like esterase